jgi:acetyl-CoA carboxylase biotin carboxyl carrier protein
MANGKAPGDPFDTRLVRKLADILRDTELTEIEVEQGDLKIRVARELTSAAPAQFAVPAAAFAAAPQPQPAALSVPTTAAPEAPRAGDVVKSPMVGTVYLQPQPGADAFVKPGDRVRQGQTLLIIEAMKVMNQIRSPRAGTVTQIFVRDGAPVEYGEPLLVVA